MSTRAAEDRTCSTVHPSLVRTTDMPSVHAPYDTSGLERYREHVKYYKEQRTPGPEDGCLGPAPPPPQPLKWGSGLGGGVTYGTKDDPYPDLYAMAYREEEERRAAAEAEAAAAAEAASGSAAAPDSASHGGSVRYG